MLLVYNTSLLSFPSRAKAPFNTEKARALITTLAQGGLAICDLYSIRSPGFNVSINLCIPDVLTCVWNNNDDVFLDNYSDLFSLSSS